MCNHQNHNAERVKEIDMEKAFLEQDFQTEDCQSNKFVPFECLKIKSIEQLYFLFSELLKLEKNSAVFLYRGQSNSDWFLDSTLEREVEKNNIQMNQYIEDQVFNNFITNLRGKLVDQSLLKMSLYDPDVESKREIWAIGRHYELKTPLIDWSSSVYVALFMACAEPQIENKIPEYFSLYIVLKNNFADIRNMVERYWFTPTTDYYGRITAQKGFLSHYSIRDDIKDRLNRDISCAFKIYIKSHLRNEILAYLKHIGIEYTTMYPDLLGAVKFANNELKEYLIKRTPSNK